MGSGKVHGEARGLVSWITLDRPEKLNAMTTAMWTELESAVTHADRGESTRVLAITGAGRAFCAGDDIAELATLEGGENLRKIVDALLGAVRTIESSRKPVVAAVNGLAYGGGCELVFACDVAFAVPGATFAAPEVRIGLFPPYGTLRFLTLAGRKRSAELFFGGEPVGAQTALEWGLLNGIVPADQLVERTERFAKAVARAPAAAVATAKRWMRDVVAGEGEEDRLYAAFAGLLRRPETHEAMKAFLNRETS